MVSEQDIKDIAAALASHNRHWVINGEAVVPTEDQIRKLVEDCIQTIRESEESISIEIGGLLIKRTEDWIDVYSHVAELEYDEE